MHNTKSKLKKQFRKNKPPFIKYYLINFLVTFLSMAGLMLVAIFLALIYIQVSDKSHVIKAIFIDNLPSSILAALGLTLFFTISQIIFTRLIVKTPVIEFAKATEKVVEGDYSAQIDIKKIRYASYEYFIIADNFNKMTNSLKEVDSLSNDFISNVSHELKTPLSVIQSYATILQNPSLSQDERKEYLNKITVSTEQLTTLVTNILKLNKMETDQLSVKKAKFNISSQLSQCLLDFEEIWDDKNITVNFEVEDDIIINSDQELLYIVWTNLISNAMKFTPDGGKITVKLTKDDEKTVIEIIDNGCGMSVETQKHIFDKFYQGDTSHSEKGNGLGLALVKRVINLLGCEIAVSSKVGVGTHFTVTINE